MRLTTNMPVPAVKTDSGPDVTATRAPASDGAWLLLFAAWMVSLVATGGALFLGEVMGMTPCVLCWYQRVLMFPLSVILALACYHGDTSVVRYALPLAGLGWLVALYHTLLYAGLIPEPVTPCATGSACTGSNMMIFGSLPIPILSWLAFTAVAGLLFAARKRSIQ